MGDVADKSVMVDPARDLLGRALEDLRRCQTWSLRGVEGFYLEGSRTPDRDYHRFDAGAGMSGAVYITARTPIWPASRELLRSAPPSPPRISPRGAINGFACPPVASYARTTTPVWHRSWRSCATPAPRPARLLDSRTEGENTRHLIRVDAFGEPITWEVRTSGSSVELAGVVAG